MMMMMMMMVMVIYGRMMAGADGDRRKVAKRFFRALSSAFMWDSFKMLSK